MSIIVSLMPRLRKQLPRLIYKYHTYCIVLAFAAICAIFQRASGNIVTLKYPLPTASPTRGSLNLGNTRHARFSLEHRWRTKVNTFSYAREQLDSNISIALAEGKADGLFDVEWSCDDCLISALALTGTTRHGFFCEWSTLWADRRCSVAMIDTGPPFNEHKLRALKPEHGCDIQAIIFVEEGLPDSTSPGVVVHRMDRTCLSVDGKFEVGCFQGISRLMMGDTLSVSTIKLNCRESDFQVLKRLLPIIVGVDQIVIELHGDLSIATLGFIRDLRFYGFVLHHQELMSTAEGAKITLFSFVSPGLAREEFVASLLSQRFTHEGETQQSLALTSFNCSDWHCVMKNGLKNHDHTALMNEIMTPFAPWFLSEYFMGDEFEQHIGTKHLNDHRSVTRISSAPHCAFLPEMAVLFVQVNFFRKFVTDCLPFLQRRMILITGQWHLPALEENADTMLTLRNPLVYHWFAQNPVVAHEKLSALPYGVKHENLGAFQLELKTPALKSITLVNLPLSPTHVDREPLIDESTSKDSMDVYYRKLKSARYVISPMGDRPDTYRHWEAIGLATVPICNCPLTLKLLFLDGMLLAEPDAMVRLLKSSKRLSNVSRIDLSTTQNLLAVGYWKARITDMKGMALNETKK